MPLKLLDCQKLVMQKFLFQKFQRYSSLITTSHLVFHNHLKYKISKKNIISRSKIEMLFKIKLTNPPVSLRLFVQGWDTSFAEIRQLKSFWCIIMSSG